MYTITFNSKTMTGSLDDMLKPLLKINQKYFIRAMQLFISNGDMFSKIFIKEYIELCFVLGTKNTELYQFIKENIDSPNFKQQMSDCRLKEVEKLYWWLVGKNNIDDILNFLLE